MNLTYSDEQSMLRESAARFLKENYPFERRRRIAASETGVDADIWCSFAELGWLGLPFAEANGGLGGGAVETAIVAEELGRAAAVEPWLSAVVLAGGLVEALGTEAQKSAVLEPLIAGISRPALAHLERAGGNDLAHVETVAERCGSGYVISGEKTLVLAAPSADTFLVTVRLSGKPADKQAMGIFIVPAGAKGVAISPFKTVDGGRAADIRFDRGAVAADALLGGSWDCLPVLEKAFDRATAALCSDAVGAMFALLDATVAYTKERVQFGKPLASFQALQHRMAEMAVKCEEARASALLATLSVDAPGVLRVRGVSGAKAKIGRVSRHVAQEAIQLHGAMGFSEEMPVGTWFKRLYAFENMFGSTAHHLARYGAVIQRPEILSGGLLRAAEPA